MSTANITLFKSRWGFHPCDWSTYRKLQYIHACYYDNLKWFAAWQRWARKRPENRVYWKKTRDSKKIADGCRPEPSFCWFFIRDNLKEALKKNPQAFVNKPSRSITLVDRGFIEDYKRAKYPKAEDQVTPLEHSVEEIERAFHELYKFFD